MEDLLFDLGMNNELHADLFGNLLLASLPTGRLEFIEQVLDIRWSALSNVIASIFSLADGLALFAMLQRAL
jgi:hypothetical protein